MVPSVASKDKRLPKIIRLRESGLSLRKIGEMYGLSHERIRQIIERQYSETILYTYKCEKCNHIEVGKKKPNTTCLYCLAKIKIRVKNPSKEIYGKEPEWRQQGRERIRHLVRYRDKFTCQVCGKRRTPEEVHAHNKKCKTGKGKIKLHDVHHLGGLCGKKSKGYDNNKDIAGLVTLCHKCHYNHPEHTYGIKKKTVHKALLST